MERRVQGLLVSVPSESASCGCEEDPMWREKRGDVVPIPTEPPMKRPAIGLDAVEEETYAERPPREKIPGEPTLSPPPKKPSPETFRILSSARLPAEMLPAVRSGVSIPLFKSTTVSMSSVRAAT